MLTFPHFPTQKQPPNVFPGPGPGNLQGVKVQHNNFSRQEFLTNLYQK